MKKKILFGIAALMIAAAATFHVQNVAFGENESYATMESIGVMAEANIEFGQPPFCIMGPNECYRWGEGNTVHIYYGRY